MVGTPHYMAPEQIEGTQIDHRCDIFAVGLVFYELLSYRRAFDGASPTAVVYKIVHEEPAPLAELAPDLDPGLIAIIARALAKRASDRYQHLSELLVDLEAAIARIEDEDREPESTILLRRDDRAPAPSSSGSGSRTSRSELVARREAQLTKHLDAANAALDTGLCDAAQAAAEQAGLLDPDDDRVLQVLERIAADRLAAQVEEHLSNARGHLKDLALTKAFESVDLALQLQPESPAARQLRREIETRRTINRWLEESERQLASGEFTGAVRSVDEVLTLDPAHEAAIELKDRIGNAARDRRARTTVDEARRRRSAGELAAAQELLEGFDDAHDLVAAELAGIKAEIQTKRASFESLMAQARSHLERGNLKDARDPMRQALEALGAGDTGQPPGPSQPGTAPVPMPDVPHPPAPSDDTFVSAATGRTTGNGDDRRRQKLVVMLGAAVATVAVAAVAALWPASLSTDGQETGFAESRDSDPGGGDIRSGASPGGDPGTARVSGTSDSGEERIGTGPERPVDPRTVSTLPVAGPLSPATGSEPDSPAPARPPPPRSPRPASPPTAPSGPDIDALLVDAVAAEAAGDVDGALDLYAGVLRRDADNRTALTGRQRVQATLVRQRLQEGNAAFTAGRYDDARRNFQDAFELNGSPAAAEGLRRVDNAEAVLCRNDAACGTLVVRVTPAAEIIVDDRSLGTAAVLELRLSAGRHRIRLETDEWRFPRALEIAAGETAEIAVDLEEDGFPR